MLHTGVLDVVDSDLSSSHSSCGNNDLLHDLFLPPNYRAVCSLVVPVKKYLISVKEICKFKAVVLNLHDKIVHV